MKFKKLAVVLTSMVISLTAVGCSSSKSQEEPQPESQEQAQEESTESNDNTTVGDKVVIGSMGPLTGELAMYGSASINGSKLYINQVKTVLDRPIELITLDDKGDAAESFNAYNRLVDNNGAVAIVGAVTSQPSSVVASAASKTNTPMITPTGTALDITAYGDNVFRACYTDPFQGKVMATFASSDLSAKNAAIIYNNDSDYSFGLYESFKETFEANGGTIVAEEAYSGSDKDFKSQLTKIANKKPEVLFIPDYYSTVALIAKQIKDIGLETTLLGADGWDSIHSVLDDPSLVEGAYFCNHYSAEDTDEDVQNFIKSYEEAYGETPNAFAALGYDGAGIMVKAISDAGSTDKDKIKEALKNMEYKGVTGMVTFDENGDPIKSVSIIQMVDGQYKMFTKLDPSDL